MECACIPLICVVFFKLFPMFKLPWHVGTCGLCDHISNTPIIASRY